MEVGMRFSAYQLICSWIRAEMIFLDVVDTEWLYFKFNKSFYSRIFLKFYSFVALKYAQ